MLLITSNLLVQHVLLAAVFYLLLLVTAVKLLKVEKLMKIPREFVSVSVIAIRLCLWKTPLVSGQYAAIF